MIEPDLLPAHGRHRGLDGMDRTHQVEATTLYQSASVRLWIRPFGARTPALLIEHVEASEALDGAGDDGLDLGESVTSASTVSTAATSADRRSWPAATPR